MCRLLLDCYLLLQVNSQLLPNPACRRGAQRSSLTPQGNKANVFHKLKENSSDHDQRKLIWSLPANSFGIQMVLLIAAVREDNLHVICAMLSKRIKMKNK